MNISISNREVGSIKIIDVQGDLNDLLADNLKRALEKLIREGNYNIIVNLKKSPLITSRSMGALVTSQIKIKKYGGEIRLAEISEQNQTVFRVTKLHTIFNIFDTEADALKDFGL